jgi:hypothetical protein
LEVCGLNIQKYENDRPFQTSDRTLLSATCRNGRTFCRIVQQSRKKLDDCVTYILNTLKKSGCCGFSDEEIYSIATHYFDEIGLEIGNPTNCKVIVNHTVELTTEEKEQARQNAIQRAENEFYERMTKARKRPNVQPEPSVQKSLFDQ